MEELVDGHIKGKVFFIVGCASPSIVSFAHNFDSDLLERGRGKDDVPILSTDISIRGLRILYQRYIHHINQRLPSKLPVRQNGCVNEAEGVK